jgi:amino acid permease
VLKIHWSIKLEALAALVGTIIGAGVFALPRVAQQSGLLITFLWLLIVLVVTIYLHLAFGEIVLRTSKDFRLPGYAGYYLGAPAKKLMLVTTFFTFSFSLLIYLLLGSQFLHTILITFLPSDLFPSGFLVIFLWLILSFIILSKRDRASKINLFLSFLLLILFIVIALYILPYFHWANVNFINQSSQWSWLIPYGVLFYALNGMVAVPEASKILQRKRAPKESLKKIIIFGIIIAAVFYLLFMITVMGVSGFATSIEAINGLRLILGSGIVFLGAMLGLLAVTTSYLIFAVYIKNSFTNDFHWSTFISNFIVIFGPLILYFLHFANVVKLISFMGGMLGGFEGAMILLILTKAKQKSDLVPAFEIPFNRFIFFALFFALLIGAVCQIFLVY